MRQLIIVRKDLGMSTGKIAAQCCHASLAYFSKIIKSNIYKTVQKPYDYLPVYESKIIFDTIGEEYNPQDKETRRIFYRHPDIYKASQKAVDLGLDYFFIKSADNGQWVWADEGEIKYEYLGKFILPQDIYEDWLNDISTKTVCEAKNKGHLLKAVLMAEELGLKENQDFFLIRDRCLTELEPEEVGKNGIGSTLTCIGFRPLDDETAHKISKKFQLLK